jgi:hypothetical protein
LESVFLAYSFPMEELFRTGKVRPDTAAVVTAPPYPEKYLPLYRALAECCAKAKIPLVAVMSPHAYLPEILGLMMPYLKYLWTMAYLVPGGQSATNFPVNVNIGRKPFRLLVRLDDLVSQFLGGSPERTV